MSSLSADSAAIVATATAPPDPPGAPIPPLLAASPRGNPNLHVAPTQPARGLEPKGPRIGCPCRSLAMPSARCRRVNSRRSGRGAARHHSAQRPRHSGARANSAQIANRRSNPMNPAAAACPTGGASASTKAPRNVARCRIQPGLEGQPPAASASRVRRTDTSAQGAQTANLGTNPTNADAASRPTGPGERADKSPMRSLPAGTYPGGGTVVHSAELGGLAPDSVSITTTPRRGDGCTSSATLGALSLPLPCWTARNPRVQTATPAATQGRTA
jgi:hypothetical protein